MEVSLSMSFWETMINTWIVMAVLVGISAWITRGLRKELPVSRKQHALEAVVGLLEGQIKEIAGKEGRRYLPFVGTLFLFIATANILSLIPPLSSFIPGLPTVFAAPTTGLETPLALALCVFFSVPFFSIRRRGVGHWLRTYIEPTPFMLPFNIIGDVSSALALAVRLFGNMMTGTVVGGILLSIAPFVFPAVMQLFGQVTGLIQAYIFAVLAMVYIGSAVQVEQEREEKIAVEASAETGPRRGHSPDA